jgi:hypothetical protein
MTDTDEVPTPEQARSILRMLLPKDRFQRKRVFLAALARMTSEGSE